MATKVITVNFTAAGIPVNGLTPTINIWNVTTSTLDVSAGVMTAISPAFMPGWYAYSFTLYNFDENYVFTIDGGVTLTACDRYKVGGNESYEEDISYQVWEEPGAAHLTLGTTGYILNQIKADTTSIIISVAAATVLIQTLLKYEQNRTRIDPIAKTLTVYDDDCVTPLQVFDLLDSTGNPSVTEVCERKPITCP